MLPVVCDRGMPYEPAHHITQPQHTDSAGLKLMYKHRRKPLMNMTLNELAGLYNR